MASLLMAGVLLGLLAHFTLTVAIELDCLSLRDETSNWQWVEQIGVTLVVGYNLVAVALLVWLVLPLLLPPAG